MIAHDTALRLLEQLERLAMTLNVEIRMEPLCKDTDALEIRSGFCRVHDRAVVIVDRRLRPVDRCRILAKAFGRYDLSRVFVPPALRQLIENQGIDT